MITVEVSQLDKLNPLYRAWDEYVVSQLFSELGSTPFYGQMKTKYNVDFVLKHKRGKVFLYFTATQEDLMRFVMECS